MKTITADWYEYPQYFDLAFRSETKSETDFVLAACQKYCGFRARRLLEPGCGTGRLVTELVKRGYQAIGFDQCPKALAYLRRRLRRRKLVAEVFEADMADFRLGEPVDVAYCLCNTFRHLLDEEAVCRHFQCVARSISPGGLYIIGMHLVPPEEDYEGYERWTERWGGTSITVTLRELNTDWTSRLETLRFILRVRTRSREFRIRSDVQMRIYTGREFCQLVDSLPQFELLDVYDFWYEIDQPLKLNDDMEDTVFVLRRR